jgi:hypothetical protein
LIIVSATLARQLAHHLVQHFKRCAFNSLGDAFLDGHVKARWVAETMIKAEDFVSALITDRRRAGLQHCEYV